MFSEFNEAGKIKNLTRQIFDRIQWFCRINVSAPNIEAVRQTLFIICNDFYTRFELIKKKNKKKNNFEHIFIIQNSIFQLLLLSSWTLTNFSSLDCVLEFSILFANTSNIQYVLHNNSINSHPLLLILLNSIWVN